MIDLAGCQSKLSQEPGKGYTTEDTEYTEF